MATLAVVPASPAPSAVTLFELEEHLAALVDTVELVPAEQEAQFLQEFQAALSTTVEKRDRVGHFLAHMESQIALAQSEIARLRERKEAYERVIARVEEYVIRTIEQLGPNAKGKYPKLEGKTITFSLRCCPASVEIKDEAAIPMEYKTVTVTLPAVAWEDLLDTLDLEARAALSEQVKKPASAVSKSSVKEALEANVVVPGADLIIGKHVLVKK